MLEAPRSSDSEGKQRLQRLGSVAGNGSRADSVAARTWKRGSRQWQKDHNCGSSAVEQPRILTIPGTGSKSPKYIGISVYPTITPILIPLLPQINMNPINHYS